MSNICKHLLYITIKYWNTDIIDDFKQSHLFCHYVAFLTLVCKSLKYKIIKSGKKWNKLDVFEKNWKKLESLKMESKEYRRKRLYKMLKWMLKTRFKRMFWCSAYHLIQGKIGRLKVDLSINVHSCSTYVRSFHRGSHWIY